MRIILKIIGALMVVTPFLLGAICMGQFKEFMAGLIMVAVVGIGIWLLVIV